VIPRIVPPLTALSVLVTRPASQAISLASSIERLGGTAVLLPAISIVPMEATLEVDPDLVIFVSVNAVAHGARCIAKTTSMRIAAIGKTTAAALAEAGLPVDLVPESGFNSEGLLAHPGLNLTASSRVLIVRGAGGRELLQETFTAQGCTVTTLDVYRRTLPAIDAVRRDEIESLWAEGGIDVVTATSAETLHNLMSLLSARGRELLSATPLLVASRRIMSAAAELGLQGECLLATGADDAALIGALSYWHGRARSG
jgi:uroporphyrinogen-III synthase